VCHSFLSIRRGADPRLWDALTGDFAERLPIIIGHDKITSVSRISAAEAAAAFVKRVAA
jgi:hypothetical protein